MDVSIVGSRVRGTSALTCGPRRQQVHLALLACLWSPVAPGRSFGKQSQVSHLASATWNDALTLDATPAQRRRVCSHVVMRDKVAKTVTRPRMEGFIKAHVPAVSSALTRSDEVSTAGASAHEITRLLRAWRAGEEGAFDELMPLVYGQLHEAAHRYMVREAADHSLQTTALVNELYLRLVATPDVDWDSRAHFFAVCAKVMRRILTDFARSRGSLKRGHGAEMVSLAEGMLAAAEPRIELLALDEALKTLETIDQRKSRVVELRFFGGLSVNETAHVLNVSPETVHRDWRFAKAWLLRELTDRTDS